MMSDLLCIGLLLFAIVAGIVLGNIVYKKDRDFELRTGRKPHIY